MKKLSSFCLVALFTVATVWAQTSYTLVTSAADLVPGAKYIIAGKASTGNAWYGLGYQKENNRKAISLSKTSSTAPADFSIIPATLSTDETKVYEVTLGGTAGAYTLYDGLNEKYLAAVSSSSNYMRLSSSSVDWTITVAGTGVATLTCTTGGYSRNIMQFNSLDNSSANWLFSCYSSGQQQVYLYKSTAPIVLPSTKKVTFSPKGGIYGEEQEVTLACATPGARIFYTTDGTTSPMDTNNTAVKRYTSALIISTTTIVKAIAFSKDFITKEDSVATAIYTIDASIPQITLTSPTEAQAFTTSSVDVQWTAENFIANTDGKFKVSVTGREDVIITETSHTINGLVTGSYNVTVALVDMSENLFSPDVSRTHAFTVDLPNVETPVITPSAGTYFDSVMVSVNCSNVADATILVSVADGAYEVYNGAIKLTASGTVRAKAFKAGMDTSAVASASYTIKDAPPAGTIYYDLVTSSSQIVAGYKYIIVGKNSSVYYGLGYQKSNSTGESNRQAVELAMPENASTLIVSEASDAEDDKRPFPIIIDGSSNSYTLKDVVNNRYLAPSDGNNNKLQTASATVKWSVSVGESGSATITCVDGSLSNPFDRNILRFNSTDNLFSCYASGQKDIYLYKRREVVSSEKISEHGVVAVKVYPNPTTGRFSVSVDDGVGDDVSASVLVEIFTPSGVCVEKKQLTSRAEFELQSKGLYLLRATFADGSVSTQKIIVK